MQDSEEWDTMVGETAKKGPSGAGEAPEGPRLFFQAWFQGLRWITEGSIRDRSLQPV